MLAYLLFWSECQDANTHHDGTGDKRVRRYMPFMEGIKRDCVGQALARLNLVATCAALYGSFSFRLAPEVMRN